MDAATFNPSDARSLAWFWFLKGYGLNYPDYPSVFCRQVGVDEGGSSYKAQGYSGLGPWVLTTEAQDHQREDLVRMHQVEIQAPEFTKAGDFSRKLLEDASLDRNPVFQSFFRAMGQSYRAHRAKIFSDFFAYAFSSLPSEYGYSSDDSLPLCSNSHPTYSGSGSTYDNLNGTSTFSPESLETARQLLDGIPDAKGFYPEPASAYLIIGGRLLAKRIWDVVATDKEVGTAHNTWNYFGPMGQSYRGLILPNLGGYYWFLCRLDDMRENLCWVTRRPVDIVRDADLDARTVSILGSARHGMGYLDARWIVGSAATA